ncbi:MAG: EF-P lysine aminoacylase EpmA [bacterium]
MQGQVSSLLALQTRARMNRFIRAFFRARGVLDVETPYLSQAGNTDPMIESAQVMLNRQMRYLHTSPEYPMKRLLAAGVGDCYQLCKAWRADEVGRRHNPEFTLLEWYRVGFSYQQLMAETIDLLSGLLPIEPATIQRHSYADCFLEKWQINPHIASQAELQTLIQHEALSIVGDLDRQALLDVLMTHCIEPSFSKNTLTLVYDYPATQAALATVQTRSDSTSDYAVAQRFEVYWGELELGNGYQELTDAAKNRQVLTQEQHYRQQHGQYNMPKDEAFLAAMATMPKAAGIAIGVDRVLMAMLQKSSIDEVISIAWDNA